MTSMIFGGAFSIFRAARTRTAGIQTCFDGNLRVIDFDVAGLRRGSGVTVVGRAGSIPASPTESSAAPAGLFSGDFSRHPRTRRARASGIWGLSVRGSGGASLFCLTATLSVVSPSKGRRPVSISKRTMPSE